MKARFWPLVAVLGVIGCNTGPAIALESRDAANPEADAGSTDVEQMQMDAAQLDGAPNSDGAPHPDGSLNPDASPNPDGSAPVN
jgi:hypothetical protein